MPSVDVTDRTVTETGTNPSGGSQTVTLAGNDFAFGAEYKDLTTTNTRVGGLTPYR